MTSRSSTLLAGGFAATECPRWRDGRLWFSDMHGGEVFAMDTAGAHEVVARVNGPGGLGWLPDGRLLVVSQRDRQVLRLDPGGLALHADLADLGNSWINDMWVGGAGRAYVGEMGFDIHAFGRGEGVEPRPANLYAVDRDGRVRVAADELLFPNGIVVDEATGTLLVAESFGFRLTSFAIGADGSLTDRRLWAQLDFAPDGITLDAEGCVWVADPVGRRAVRVAPGGAVLDEITTDRTCLSCALGGDDGRTLFICTTGNTDPHQSLLTRSSRIDVASVAVPAPTTTVRT